MKLFRIVAALAAFAATSLSVEAQVAKEWPNRPVRIIVPFAAGGSTDVAARLIADYLSRAVGQQFYVENRAGANGVIAGIKGLVLDQWLSVFVPAGTSPAIVARLTQRSARRVQILQSGRI